MKGRELLKAHKEISLRTLGTGFAVQNFISEHYLPSLSLTDLGSSDLFQEIQPSLKERKYDITKIFKLVPSSLFPKGKAASKEGGSDSLGPGFGGPFFREPPRGEPSSCPYMLTSTHLCPTCKSTATLPRARWVLTLNYLKLHILCFSHFYVSHSH